MKKTRSMTAKQEAEAQDVPLGSLEGPHHDIAIRCIKNILSTEISKITLAQVVDGLPLSDVERDNYSDGGNVTWHHPLHSRHQVLCAGVLEKTHQLYDTFDVDSIRVDAKLLHEFRTSATGSRAFRTRLVELAAVSIHYIAVQLWNLPGHFHDNDSIAGWEPDKDNKIFWIRNPDGAPPTLFQHRQYRAYQQYPNGVADGVGYWAESRIFGGVVLFDRRSVGSADDVDPEAIWMHPDRRESTYRICKLLDSQRLNLVEFLLSDDMAESSSCPLPIVIDEDNYQREDPEEDLEDTGIYRDLWERRRQTLEDGDLRLKDVINRWDYPTDADYDRASRRARERREKQYYKHDLAEEENE